MPLSCYDLNAGDIDINTGEWYQNMEEIFEMLKLRCIFYFLTLLFATADYHSGTGIFFLFFFGQLFNTVLVPTSII